MPRKRWSEEQIVYGVKQESGQNGLRRSVESWAWGADDSVRRLTLLTVHSWPQAKGFDSRNCSLSVRRGSRWIKALDQRGQER